MRKLVGKLIAVTLAFALVLGLAVPVHANTALNRLVDYGTISFEMPDFPSSFNFASEMSLELAISGNVPEEAVMIAGMVDGFTVRESGTVYMDGLAMSMFTETAISLEQLLAAIPMDEFMPMLGLLNLDLNEPIRTWVEIDMNDLNNPVFIIVLEMPTIVRLPLAMLGAEFTRQFWVIDLGAEIMEIAAEIEAEIRQLTEEQIEEMMMYIEEALEELMAYIEYYLSDIEETLAELWAEIQEVVTVHSFNFGYNVLTNGYSAYLNLALTIAEAGVVADIAFDFAGEVTNLNTAARVPLPQLTAQNSFNINFTEMFAMHPYPTLVM
jgi:hypothetical protein